MLSNPCNINDIFILHRQKPWRSFEFFLDRYMLIPLMLHAMSSQCLLSFVSLIEDDVSLDTEDFINTL